MTNKYHTLLSKQYQEIKGLYLSYTKNDELRTQAYMIDELERIYNEITYFIDLNPIFTKTQEKLIKENAKFIDKYFWAMMNFAYDKYNEDCTIRNYDFHILKQYSKYLKGLKY